MMVLCGRAAANAGSGVTPLVIKGNLAAAKMRWTTKQQGLDGEMYGALISTELEILLRLQAWNMRSAIVIERFIRLASGDEKDLLQSLVAKTY